MSNSLETEIGSALTSENISAVELSALIIRVQAAIYDADAEAKRNEEAVFELNSDPKAAHAAMEEAVICSGRLNTALIRLHRKKAAAENAERVAAWQAEFANMTAKRNDLAAELVAAFSEMSRIAEIFSRVTVFEVELSKFHQSRPSGVPGMVTGPELEARGLDAFNRAAPSLLNQIKLFSLSGKAVWPPVQSRNWAHQIPVIEAQFGGARWWDKQIQEARQEQVKKESDRVTAYYAEQARLREERERQEENWKQIGGASK